MTLYSDGDPWPRHKKSAYQSFRWLHWLVSADPDCTIAKAALEDVQEQYPDFVALEHPDFTNWMEAQTVKSAWTAEALLTNPAAGALPELLVYQPTDQRRFDEHGRWAMLKAVGDAARTSPSWALDLADAMVDSSAWNSDLWYEVITAWAATEFDQGGRPRLLSHLSAGELQQQYPREIASVLSKLAQNARGAESTEWLDKANHIAAALRSYAAREKPPGITSSVGGVPQYVSCLQRAINHASGQLALFWIHSTSLWQRQQSARQSLDVEYRNALDAIVREDGVSGQFGRSVLASQFNFFVAIDETWALENLLPLFEVDHEDFQCSWDGILTWGSLSPSTAEYLSESMINAIQRVTIEFDDRMLARFVEFYVTAMAWLIRDANDGWVSRFFTHADPRAREQFASQIGRRLQNLDENAQAEWWNAWLKNYWHNRLQGVPIPLDDAEITQMLGWVVNLTGVFPEVVDTATDMRKAPIGRSLLAREIGESNLAERHPVPLSKLLIHVGQCTTEPWFWLGAGSVVNQLLEKDLPPDVEEAVRDLIAKHRLH